MELLAIFAIVIASVIFAYQIKVPIMYIMSAFISFAGSAFMFNLSSNAEGAVGSYTMFGIIFIAIGLWQLGEATREYIR